MWGFAPEEMSELRAAHAERERQAVQPATALSQPFLREVVRQVPDLCEVDRACVVASLKRQHCRCNATNTMSAPVPTLVADIAM